MLYIFIYTMLYIYICICIYIYIYIYILHITPRAAKYVSLWYGYHGPLILHSSQYPMEMIHKRWTVRINALHSRVIQLFKTYGCYGTSCYCVSINGVFLSSIFRFSLLAIKNTCLS